MGPEPAKWPAVLAVTSPPRSADRTAWWTAWYEKLRRKRRIPPQDTRLLGRSRSVDYTFPVDQSKPPDIGGHQEGRGREAISIHAIRPPKPLRLEEENQDSHVEELGPLTVPPQPDWRRFKNRSVELTRPTPKHEGPPVGSRMYTLGTNPGQLMETETPSRNVFYDPRKKRPARFPKEKISDHGSLNALKNMVVKYTKVESSASFPEAVERIERDDFGIEFLWKIGEGAYGGVYAAKRVKSNKLLAVKIYLARHEKLKELKDNAFARNSLIVLLQEIIVMKILRGKAFFAQILDHFIINERIYLVMEMEDDTLSHQLEFYPTGMPEAKARKWFFQMAQGLAYLHKIGIAHCDIKADNVLIRKIWDGTTLCKYTDFGLSKFLPHAHQNIKGWISSERDRFQTVTRHYVPNESTEIRRLRDYWNKAASFVKLGMASETAASADIYRLSFVLYRMLSSVSSQHFKYTMRDMPKEQLLQKRLITCGLEVTRIGKDFLWTIIQNTKENQITAEEMVRHLWLLYPGEDPGLLVGPKWPIGGPIPRSSDPSDSD